MVKIKTYKIARKGVRGLSVALPKVWVEDLGLKPGDKLDFYRTEDDMLIITKSKERGNE